MSRVHVIVLALYGAVLSAGLMTPLDAAAATEVTPKCYNLSPFSDTLRVMRIKSNLGPPGMQAVFIRWRLAGVPGQLLGSGLITASLVDPAKQNLGATFATNELGADIRSVALSVVIDPATDSGPAEWHVEPAAFPVTATLVPIPCASAFSPNANGSQEEPTIEGPTWVRP